MKTIREHLESIEDKEIREKALANMNKEDSEECATDIEDALCGAFVWDTSPEGGSYWVNVRRDYTPHLINK